MEERYLKGVKERFPVMANLDKECEEGEVEYVLDDSKIKTSRGEDSDNTRYIFMVPTRQDPELNLEHLHGAASKLREMAAKTARGEIRIALPPGLNEDHIREDTTLESDAMSKKTVPDLGDGREEVLVRVAPDTTRANDSVALVPSGFLLLGRKKKEKPDGPPTLEEENASQNTTKLDKLVEKASCGTQVSGEDMKQDIELKRIKEGNLIRKALSQHEGYDKLATVLDMDWPGEIYRTKVTYGPIPNQNQNSDLAIILEVNTQKEEESMREVLDRCPEVGKLIDEGLIGGEVEYIQNVSEVTSSWGGSISCRDKMNAQGEEKVTIWAAENLEEDICRKWRVYAFLKEEMEITLLRREPKRRKINRYRRPDDKIIIKANGMQYSDPLKAVKASVNIEQEGVKIKQIRKTMKGDLMLEVEGGKEKSERLMEAIKAKEPNYAIDVRRKDAD
ncbi:unnamed protein product [Phaedon cochleariae]|uniref:Uncharacterized protein n=1 Tax=Phaedon cochleariae TaxID=80249 RepID=A0A9N9SDU7_PHACE|nr:unnamed protein product [Phaedon cochleariae]